MMDVDTKNLDGISAAVVAGAVTGGLVVLSRPALFSYEVPGWFRKTQVLLVGLVVGLLASLAYEARASRLVMLLAHGATTLLVTVTSLAYFNKISFLPAVLVLILPIVIAAASIADMVDPGRRGTINYYVCSAALVFLYVSLMMTGLVAAFSGRELSALPLLLALSLVFLVYYVSMIEYRQEFD